MNRFLTDTNFSRFQHDFTRVMTIIRDSQGEYDLRFRKNYLNLYSRGNSIARIAFKPGRYEITTHVKFAEGVFSKDKQKRFSATVKGTYATYRVCPELVTPFFQKAYLQKMANRVADVDCSEEVEFEQLIIADNWGSESWLIIDRQVIHPGLRRNRIDLLALKREQDGAFHFHVVEVKMGNNPELREEVADQLERYLRLIKQNLQEWKEGYLRTVKQMRILGLLPQLDCDLLQIGDKVDGSVAVFGYPKAAKDAIKQLKAKHPEIVVKRFSFPLPSE